MHHAKTGYAGGQTEASGQYIRAAREEWIGLLDRWNWQLFCTFTFRSRDRDSRALTLIDPEQQALELWPWDLDAQGTRDWRDTRLAYVHPEQADKLFRVVVSWTNRRLFGPRWPARNRGIRWVRAVEFQRRRVIHFHALFGEIGNIEPSEIEEAWERLAGFAKVEPIIRAEAVSAYVTKYCLKGGEIDVGGPGLARPASGGGRCWPRPIPWYLRPLGRSEAHRTLREATTPDELKALQGWADGSRSHRESLPLVARVRERIRPVAPGCETVTDQVRGDFAAVRKLGHRR